jgi:pyridine nucleotide-disulfide oxidoreductase
VTPLSFSERPFNVLIVGGGVAALEAALALHELGHERIATTILAPNPEFVYRPMTVREPFSYPLAQRYPLEQIARELDVELQVDSFKWLEPSERTVHTVAGERLSYDALLLALGARLYPRFKDATTIDDARIDEQLHGLIQDIEGGYVHRLALLIPSGRTWPLPIYELALLCAARARDVNVELSITIATPEDAPLAIFGRAVSDGVRQLLEGERHRHDHLGPLRGSRIGARCDQPGLASAGRRSHRRAAGACRAVRAWGAWPLRARLYRRRPSVQSAHARARVRSGRRDGLRDQARRDCRAAGGRRCTVDRGAGRSGPPAGAVPSRDSRSPADRRHTTLSQRAYHRRAWVELRDHRHADLVTSDEDRREVPRAVPGKARPHGGERHMTAAIFSRPTRHTVHWHFFTISFSTSP